MATITPVEKPVRTSLVTDLINYNKVVTITEGAKNQTTPESKFNSDNGVGTNSTVTYNPSYQGNTIPNADGSKGRPPQVGLGHELGHAHCI